MLLDANPCAASHPERYYGKIPLHVAKDVVVARLLLNVFPDGVGARDKQGQLPIHKVSRSEDYPPEIAIILLDGAKALGKTVKIQCGAMALDNAGKTPLDFVCEKIAEHKQRWNLKGRIGPLDGRGKHFWKKLETLVKDAAPDHFWQRRTQIGDCKENLPFLIVHYLLDLNCLPQVVIRAIHMYSEQLRIQDGFGRTPLAVAVENKLVCSEVITLLLDAERGYPHAAKTVDCRGCLPLHHFASSGHNQIQSLSKLIAANPEALQTYDGKNGLLPFMLAAVRNDDRETAVDTVYTLIREAPWALVSALSHCVS